MRNSRQIKRIGNAHFFHQPRSMDFYRAMADTQQTRAILAGVPRQN